MRLGFDVSVSSVTTGNHDLLVEAYTDGAASPRRLIKAQVKTLSSRRLGLKGGARGGKERKTISDEKIYKYTEEHCALIIGVARETMDLYLFPTRFAERYKSSVGQGKLTFLRNNWDILLNWNDTYLQNVGQLLPR